MITVEITDLWQDFFIVKEDLSDYFIMGHKFMPEDCRYQIYSDSEITQLTLAPKALAWWSDD